MQLLNAKEFSKMTGFPLAYIRRLCRTGEIPHWKMGKVYLLDYDNTLEVLESIKGSSLSRSSTAVFSARVSVGAGKEVPEDKPAKWCSDYTASLNNLFSGV